MMFRLLPVLSFLVPLAAFGQTSYTPMVEFGPIVGAQTLSSYLTGIFQVTIGIAGLLAVVMIVVCGIRLMGAGSVSGKEEAKSCIWNAVFGVLLALGSWALLYTINPILLTGDLTLGDVNTTPDTATPGPYREPVPTRPGWYYQYQDSATGAFRYRAAGNSAAACLELEKIETETVVLIPGSVSGCFYVPPGSVGGGEIGVRQALCGNDSCVGATPVGVNKQPCVYVGEKNCTNVEGLGGGAIGLINGLPGSCGCNVVVTGGTEYWAHSQKACPTACHMSGNDVFDMRRSASLDAFIKANGTNKSSSQLGWRWLYNGFWWNEEGDHWHVCPDGASASYCNLPP